MDRAVALEREFLLVDDVVAATRGPSACRGEPVPGGRTCALRGGASHEAKGRRGARSSGAGRVGPHEHIRPTRKDVWSIKVPNRVGQNGNPK